MTTAQLVEYETVIGLEVHVQLGTKSKMFCRCSADYADAPPNSHVCPVCMGLPGVLPTINKQAVEYTMMTALALGCAISPQTKFDRKNYPYPDLMKGYQISQYDNPIGKGGWLEFPVDGRTHRVGITRVHLEEDVAKLLHRAVPGGEGYSLMDVNRSGVPLMEVVSEPDMRSAEAARQYLMALRTILRYLGVSTANMEEGSFRCDANISIRPAGSKELLTKVEVKNMNSFKAVYLALEFEAIRQRAVLGRGERLVQETRGWQDETGQTVSQRSKEFAHDYRYFPEPDLPPLELDCDWVERLRQAMPELPEARKQRFSIGYGLSEYDAGLLTETRALADYFEACLDSSDFKQLPQERAVKEVANWLLGPVAALVNASGADFASLPEHVAQARLMRLLLLVSQSAINSGSGKVVLEEMYRTGQGPEEIVQARGLGQISQGATLEEAVGVAIAANPKAVAEYRSGKAAAIQFLVGAVMRATKGRANPNLTADMIKKSLEEG